ncbi:MAG: 3-phosphoshikimate 1-carboxyvinyltransferase [Planctomycetota bacterium]|nr:3-phosphoshikimate 1-carboxyvinyltransferase [Planctomycetota bacterium]
MTSFLCLGQGSFRLDGTARMRQRPIDDLVDGLRDLGVRVAIEGEKGCPPVRVDAAGLPGGRVKVSGGKSSQYISGLMMVAPYARAPLEVEVVGEFVSQPYVELTLRTMADLGVGTTSDGNRLFRPTHGARYRGGNYAVEGDATASSYFLAAAAILGGRAVVTNVRADSPQGDAAFAKILARMGCRVRMGFLAGNYGIEVIRDPAAPLEPVHVDLNDMPDVAQTLAAVALFARGPSSFINIANLRIKETDRLKALAAELTRLGAKVEEGPDYLELDPGTPREAVIETYDDHRMAMAMALVGLGRPGVTIDNPSCVAKTYPHYFDDLKRLRR